jgi:uncharacterized membrane protein YraQ (UPF0718 family)
MLMLIAIATAVASASSTRTVVVVAVPALPIATVIMLRRVFLKPLVLFPNVGQQILA